MLVKQEDVCGCGQAFEDPLILEESEVRPTKQQIYT